MDSTNHRKCVSNFPSLWLANQQWLFNGTIKARTQIVVPIGHPEQGLRRWLLEGLDQRFSFVCGAAYLLLKRIRCCCMDYWVPNNFEYYNINFASRAFTEKQMAANRYLKNKLSLIKMLLKIKLLNFTICNLPELYPSFFVTHSISTAPSDNRPPTSVESEAKDGSPTSASVTTCTPTSTATQTSSPASSPTSTSSAVTSSSSSSPSRSSLWFLSQRCVMCGNKKSDATAADFNLFPRASNNKNQSSPVSSHCFPSTAVKYLNSSSAHLVPFSFVTHSENSTATAAI